MANLGRKRLGGTSGDREDSGKKKGRDTRICRASRMCRRRDNCYKPCGTVYINVNGLI